MIFESPVLGWLVLALVLIILSGVLLLSIGFSRLLRVRSGILPLSLFVVGICATAYGITRYLDAAGTEIVGEVLDKSEQLVYHLDGTWAHKMLAQVKYSVAPGTPPVSVQLDLLQPRFDEMRRGDFVQLRHAELGGLLAFTRLESQDIQSQFIAALTDRPFFLIAGLGLLGVLAARLIFGASPPVLLLLTAICTLAAWWIGDIAVPIVEQAAMRMTSRNTVSANVREIRQPRIDGDIRGWVASKLYAPNELILLDMTPLGRGEPLMAIDAVDLGSSVVRAGDAISVQYSPTNPRIAFVADGDRNYLWKNSLLSTLFAALAVFGLVWVSVPVKPLLRAIIDWLPPRRQPEY